MSWETKVVERDALYREVWAEPMTTVAKRYGISDVALRKVCIKLNVPIPPAGHWAKVRHGKRVEKPALRAATGHVQHAIQRWLDPEAPEFEARLQTVAVEAPKPSVDVVRPSSLEECHKVVRNTDAALEKGRLDEAGRLLSAGRGCCDVRVTASARTRAVLLCEQLLRTWSAAGLKFEERLSSTDGPRLHAGGRWYRWRITEVGVAGAPEGTSQVPSKTLAGRRRPPAGLRIDFVDDAQSGSALTYRDNAQGRLEAKVLEMPAGLLHVAAATKLRLEMAEEKRRAQEAWWEDQRRRAARRREELERLKKTEELASRLQRAESLRAYASTVEVQRFEERPLDPLTLEERLQWIRRAADWLDPTRSGHWPEVDDAPASMW